MALLLMELTVIKTQPKPPPELDCSKNSGWSLTFGLRQQSLKPPLRTGGVISHLLLNQWSLLQIYPRNHIS